jgi:hypothetical protein
LLFLPGVFCRDFSLGFWRDPWDCFVDAKLHKVSPPFFSPFSTQANPYKKAIVTKKKPKARSPKEPPPGALSSTAKVNTAREKSIATEIASTAPAIMASVFTFAFST